MHRFGLINSALCLFLLAGCGTKYEDCGEGLARADDGNCYQYRFSDTGGSSGLPGGNGSGLDDPPDDGGIDADGIDGDGGPADTDGGPVDTDGGPIDTDGGPVDTDGGPVDTDGGPVDTDGGTPDGGTPDGGTPDGGTPDGGTPDGGAPDGGAPDGGAPDGGAPDGGAPDGGTPDGGAPDGGAPDGGGDGGGIKYCDSDADCELEDCISGSVGCGCLDAIGECVPTCGSDSDCPEGEDLVCSSGFCEPAGGGVDVSPPDSF